MWKEDIFLDTKLEEEYDEKIKDKELLSSMIIYLYDDSKTKNQIKSTNLVVLKNI